MTKKPTNRRIDPADIERAEAVSLADIADARGLTLKRVGSELVGACVKCGGRDRFAINIAKNVFNCRGCGGKGNAISFVMWLHGSGFVEAVEVLTGRAPHKVHRSTVYLGPEPEPEPKPKPKPKPSAADHRQQAAWLWQEAGPVEATPAAIYLTKRGLHPPSPDVVRFHPHCPFGRDANGCTVTTPAMLALVRNIVSNEPQAIHRTALDLDGSKVELVGDDDRPRSRRALGSLQGGAVKLTDDAKVTKAVGIGEGIESTLSLQQLPEWFGSPVWSLLSKNGVREFPVLPGIETLMIAVDHDEKQDGQKAASAATARWRAAGREVLLAWPTLTGDDINDVVRGVS
ncbi:toprim domain-containing protein [Bradyrhizobium sp. 2]|uniref:DUF7146 domain-containing protein n=1 Tax=unclassified Bradyrhizobium TaxID=2631580 RepID=UPI001FFBA742|nr:MULTISPECIES: toprim domain-containing protein [unclassified Bradyrhizobium]MCK1447753.1 toprim domain-containing protein [Bradyrhizobium sp. 48]MCK1463322.1 toprim domain-containing protein [Bradyrhizobium sp. 2]